MSKPKIRVCKKCFAVHNPNKEKCEHCDNLLIVNKYIPVTTDKRKKDRTGQIFGDYVVIRRDEPHYSAAGKVSKWIVQCTFCRFTKSVFAIFFTDKNYRYKCKHPNGIVTNLEHYWEQMKRCP